MAPEMALDIARLRTHFPSLSSGIAHFDSAGGTQTPGVVGRAVAATLTGPLSNRGTNLLPERNAEQAVAGFRSAFADFLNADPRGVVYGRSATQLGYDFSRHLGRDWGPGDEIVVTRLDHDANIRPWVQAAARQGATVRWIGVDPDTAGLCMDQVADAVGPATRLVAVTAASNLLGTRPDIPAIARLAHAAGALLYVDGVHYAAHAAVDIRALGADFFVCSPYKFFGPHCAVLAAEPDLLGSIRPDKLLPSTDAVPERFEFGTLPYELLAGATAAVDFIASLGGTGGRRERLAGAFAAIEAREAGLLARVEEFLAGLDAATVHSRSAARTATLLASFRGHEAAQVSRFLAGRDVQAPAGSFYAVEASRRLGLGDAGGLRIGPAPYTSDEDVQRLLDGLAEYFS
ncbi:cysteine desulfurase-like protein [Arthrobacter sp. GCM10027362]|uniref:cysteine desulfurase-like protein n=1 Tax=Arthrobacter sp. GCM10027362 TaxID=3273379 RepID=UPI00364395D6